MRRKDRGTQTDAKASSPQADQCLISLQRGLLWKGQTPGSVAEPGSTRHTAALWSARGAVLAVPAPSLLPAPWGTELRSRESLDTLQALFCSTGVLSAQFYLQAGKVQVAMKQLTPSQPAPAHSFIPKSSYFFPFPQCRYLLSSFPFFCTMIVPPPLSHPLYDSSHCGLSQKEFVTSSVYLCTQAGREGKWGAV